jgi:hypothetical protein
MVDGLADKPTVGFGLTVIDTVLVEVQPLATAPVTVYIVVMVGDTIAPLLKLPGIMV